jgi:Protein of unknown function (DUF2939)
MKRFFVGITLLIILLVGYWMWPYVGLRSLAADIQARDPAALSEDVDFVRLRRSLTEQIIAAYLEVTGRAKKLSPFESAVATGIGSSIADPLIAQLVTPENLLVLLRGQDVPTDFGSVSFKFGELPTVSWGSVWAAWLSSDYGIGRFSIGVPVSSPSAQQFRIQMELRQWRWKLTGVGLPGSVRNQFGHELAKKFP